MDRRVAAGDEQLTSALMNPASRRRFVAIAPGAVVAAVIAGLLIASFGALLPAADSAAAARALHDPYLWHVVGFTLLQAMLSTLVSVVPAIAVARALSRRSQFPGRDLLIRLLGLPMVVPVVVAVLGIVAVFGQAGIINRMLVSAGFEPWSFLYGLPGILIGHAFFNLPLATRLLLPAWSGVPGETWRLASQLGMRPGAIFRLIEWPLLRERLPGVAAIVFMLCMTSFAVVLILGGGPAGTTVEVAIYQALRFDFDPSRASVLAFLQLGLSLAAILLSQRWTRPFDLSPSVGRRIERPDTRGALSLTADTIAIVLAALFLLMPLAAIVLAGLAGRALAMWGDARLWLAATRSLGIAFAAGVLSVGAALALQFAIGTLQRAGRGSIARTIDLTGSIALGLSPLAFGAGLFLLLVKWVGPFRWSLAPVVVLSAFLALPYAMRLLGPALANSRAVHDRLCAALGISGWNRWRLVEWPSIRPAIGMALALSVALAIGDLAAIALFGAPDQETLPLLLYQLIGSYQLAPAAGVALFLILTVAAVFIAIERGIGGGRRAGN